MLGGGDWEDGGGGGGGAYQQGRIITNKRISNILVLPDRQD